MAATANTIYLNNSATSFPKPEVVAKALYDSMITLPGMSGRGEETASARDVVQHARVQLARFLGCPRPERLIFCSNSSDGLNLAIHGFVRQHFAARALNVITTTNDHNSVLRPLRTLEREGLINLKILPMKRNGEFDHELLLESISEDTDLFVINHLSNVVGTIAPLAKLGEHCRGLGVTTLVDASQSAGLLPINVAEMKLDMLAITGHKYMFGPTGIGALYIDESVTLKPLKQGGTGVKSEEPFQPEELPVLFEAGTVNYHGIAALDAAREYIQRQGMQAVLEKPRRLAGLCRELLADTEGVAVYGPEDSSQCGSVVSFRLEGHGVAEADMILRGRHGLILRPGLHCAPLCHKRLGTFPEGTLRASFSYLNEESHVRILADAVRELRGQ